jgi:hypothetical protein
MVNLIAAESLPPDLPAFLRTPQSIAEIAYLGPEPDRWRPEMEPELSNVSGHDHVFRTELGSLASPLPRRRTDFVTELENMRTTAGDATKLRPELIGTLPWQAEEVYERLQSAFRSYRIAAGTMQPWPDEAPITANDLPYIEASIRYYAGWLGHYIADGSMPLHDTVNLAGWVIKDNPNGYTQSGSIHHRFEQAADDAIAAGQITDKQILAIEPAPKSVDDPFEATLQYLYAEAKYAPGVYDFEKNGAFTKDPKAVDEFIAHRMAEGGAMLRDLIESAWIHSAAIKAPAFPKTVPVPTNSPWR